MHEWRLHCVMSSHSVVRAGIRCSSYSTGNNLQHRVCESFPATNKWFHQVKFALTETRIISTPIRCLPCAPRCCRDQFGTGPNWSWLSQCHVRIQADKLHSFHYLLRCLTIILQSLYAPTNWHSGLTFYLTSGPEWPYHNITKFAGTQSPVSLLEICSAWYCNFMPLTRSPCQRSPTISAKYCVS